MKYKYTWQELKRNDSDILRVTANAHLQLMTDESGLILDEEYVPLLDLVGKIGDWGFSGYFEYSPDGYEENPMLSFLPQEGRFRVDSPDIRTSGENVVVDKNELVSFHRKLSQDMSKDVEILSH